MKKRNNSPTRSLVGAAVLILVGLILLVNPDFGSATISRILGWILVTLGGMGIVLCVYSWPLCGFAETAVSLASLILGIYLLFHPLALASILGMGLGACLLIHGIGRIATALRLRRQGGIWTPSLTLALVTAVIGGVLLFSPLTTSRILMILCGIGLILWGATILLLHVRASKSQNQQSDIIDAQ